MSGENCGVRFPLSVYVRQEAGVPMMRDILAHVPRARFSGGVPHARHSNSSNFPQVVPSPSDWVDHWRVELLGPVPELIISAGDRQLLRSLGAESSFGRPRLGSVSDGD